MSHPSADRIWERSGFGTVAGRQSKTWLEIGAWPTVVKKMGILDIFTRRLSGPT